MLSTILDKYKDIGILIIRVGLGIAFITIHGIGKLKGGPELWTKLGGAMKNLGITFYPEFWGFMAMFAEFFIPFFIIAGFLFRPAMLIISFNMFVAMLFHLSQLDPWGRVAPAMELMIVFIGLFFLGAGKYSVDRMIWKKKE
jgi:putative oxidoreductase